MAPALPRYCPLICPAQRHSGTAGGQHTRTRAHTHARARKGGVSTPPATATGSSFSTTTPPSSPGCATGERRGGLEAAQQRHASHGAWPSLGAAPASAAGTQASRWQEGQAALCSGRTSQAHVPQRCRARIQRRCPHPSPQAAPSPACAQASWRQANRPRKRKPCGTCVHVCEQCGSVYATLHGPPRCGNTARCSPPAAARTNPHARKPTHAHPRTKPRVANRSVRPYVPHSLGHGARWARLAGHPCAQHGAGDDKHLWMASVITPTPRGPGCCCCCCRREGAARFSSSYRHAGSVHSVRC